jgi:hypothetical protein
MTVFLTQSGTPRLHDKRRRTRIVHLSFGVRQFAGFVLLAAIPAADNDADFAAHVGCAMRTRLTGLAIVSRARGAPWARSPIDALLRVAPWRGAAASPF